MQLSWAEVSARVSSGQMIFEVRSSHSKINFTTGTYSNDVKTDNLEDISSCFHFKNIPHT